MATRITITFQILHPLSLHVELLAEAFFLASLLRKNLDQATNTALVLSRERSQAYRGSS